MEKKSGYVPPQLRNKNDYKPKNLAYKPKMIWTPDLKSKEELYEEYSKKNYGKGDNCLPNCFS